MESIFFMMFEIATPTTTVNVYSGEPGTAKSMRFKRFQASMSPGIVVQGGNKSARAGMQGACAFVGNFPNFHAHAVTPLPQATTTRKTAASCTPTR
jgi:hypothetical protein